MAVVACPQCGARYNLKDGFIGRQLKCTTCAAAFDAVETATVAAQPQASHQFDRDRFFMRQKVMSLNERYAVNDENGTPLIFVIRRTHVLKGLLAALGAIITLIVVGALVVTPAIVFGDQRQFQRGDLSALMLVWLIAGGVVAVASCVVVAVLIYPKRHVEFYANGAYTQKLLDVLQDSKWQIINATFTVRDAAGTTIARFHKNYLYNFFRRRWNVQMPDSDALICRAFEDSVLLSILRRFLGSFYGLLRTNYIITAGESDETIGEFNRKFAIFDKYVLDMTADPTRQLDRRLAVALGVMLDAGEKR